MPTLLSLIKRLHAAARLVEVASEVLPQLDSKDSILTISSQIAVLRGEIEKQIAAVERSMQSFGDRLETIAQFLLLHRAKLGRARTTGIEQLIATIRGHITQPAA